MNLTFREALGVEGSTKVVGYIKGSKTTQRVQGGFKVPGWL